MTNKEQDTYNATSDLIKKFVDSNQRKRINLLTQMEAEVENIFKLGPSLFEIFDNDERSIIGTIYKKEGRKKAVIEGLKFFEKKMELLLDNLFMSIESYKTIANENNEFFIKIYCSRGGMRSQSIAWVLEKYKLNPITLKGGYKIYRRWVLDSFSKKLNIVVIGGKTGTGKTRLLSLLEKSKYQTIDLEGFACHRGSTFGGLGMKEQPTLSLIHISEPTRP